MWTVLSAETNNGLVRVLLSRDAIPGQPEVILMNVVPKAFGQEFMTGDIRGPDLQLVSRVGTNGSG